MPIPKLALIPLMFCILVATAFAEDVEVHFSPKGGIKGATGCTDAIVREIKAARFTILVEEYSFTLVPIAKALVTAHKRGVKVEVILDKGRSKSRRTQADFLHNSGISVKIDGAHPKNHNKVMVIDGAVVVSGSFNLSKEAEYRNAENVLVIRGKTTAEKYIADWNRHAEHSEAYQGRKEKAPPVRG